MSHMEVIDHKAFNDPAALDGLISLYESSRSLSLAQAACCNPRHALAYESAAGAARLEICFECQQMEVTIAGTTGQLSASRDNLAAMNALYAKLGQAVPAD